MQEQTQNNKAPYPPRINNTTNTMTFHTSNLNHCKVISLLAIVALTTATATATSSHAERSAPIISSLAGRRPFGVQIVHPTGTMTTRKSKSNTIHPSFQEQLFVRGGHSAQTGLSDNETLSNSTQNLNGDSPIFELNILSQEESGESEQSSALISKNTQDCSTIQSQGRVDADVDEREYKRALTQTTITVAAAGLFGIGVMATRGVSSGYEFFAGYLIEQSLSIDNLFVFIMLFDYFKIPMNLQNRVLSWGIGGAILLRGLMIGVGVAALQQFRSVILVFAGILIASSINLLLEKEHNDGDVDGDGGGNIIMKLTKFIFPNTSSELHGEAFFITNEAGKKIATPLFLCLVCVELSDFVFAVDSIPAVLGVSKDPLIVYASNIFAIMALRSLYTVVAKAVSSFHYLKPAVALVLGFVGSKMVGEFFHFDIGTGVSLVVICSLLGGGIGASILENQRREMQKGVVHSVPE